VGTFNYATSTGNSEAAALEAAERDCDGSDCSAHQCVERGCVAIEFGGIVYGLGFHSGAGQDDAQVAEQDADQVCRKFTYGCGDARHFCSENIQ